MTETERLYRTVTEIARRELGVATLRTRGNDSLDFHSVSAASIKAALEAAYAAGAASDA